MNEEWNVTWICPDCGVENLDNIEETANPVCSECDGTFFWGEIAPLDLKAFNSVRAMEDSE